MKEKGLSIFHGTLNAGEIMYLPAGWVIGQSDKSNGGGIQVGIRLVFLQKHKIENNAAQLAALQVFKPIGKEAKLIEAIQDLLVLLEK